VASSKIKYNIALADKHIVAFKSEIGMLLRFQLAYERISNFRILDKISRTEFVDTYLSLKALENNTLIRLCKFDDKRKDVHSFHNYLKILSKEDPNYKAISNKVTIFSTSIKDLKELGRNDQIAHLKIGKLDNDYETKYEFKPIIKSLELQTKDLLKKNNEGITNSA